MFHMPMSSPMMTTMLGLCPAGAGEAAGCCACAEVVSPAAVRAEAATRELPLNRRSRRFIPALESCVVLVSELSGFFSRLMTYSLFDDATETDVTRRRIYRL